ncbi:MAG: ferritin family protein [Clostridiales bacterium]|nr:ferritin family protein [Clostridiales bacterium]
MNILEFAVNMEKEGEAFYRSQAKENEGGNLFKVFSILADDEKQHAKILSGLLKNEKTELSYSEISNVSGVFKDFFKKDIKLKPVQLDIYRKALKKETESINLYIKLLEETSEPNEMEIFDYLIKQEELHHTAIEDIIYHLEKAESWVESAEFGTREEY